MVKHPGFHMSNAAVAIISSLDNMTIAATSDRDIIEALTTTNSQLMETNSSLTDKF